MGLMEPKTAALEPLESSIGAQSSCSGACSSSSSIRACGSSSGQGLHSFRGSRGLVFLSGPCLFSYPRYDATTYQCCLFSSRSINYSFGKYFSQSSNSLPRYIKLISSILVEMNHLIDQNDLWEEGEEREERKRKRRKRRKILDNVKSSCRS